MKPPAEKPIATTRFGGASRSRPTALTSARISETSPARRD